MKKKHFNRAEGVVISLRIRPADCLKVLDFSDAIGLPRSLTFPQRVSMVLTGLLQSAQNSGVIGEPDMFQYLNRMQQHIVPLDGKKVAELVGKIDFTAAPQNAAVSLQQGDQPVSVSGEVMADGAKLAELLPVIESGEYSTEQWGEYQKLMWNVYQERV